MFQCWHELHQDYFYYCCSQLRATFHRFISHHYNCTNCVACKQKYFFFCLYDISTRLLVLFVYLIIFCSLILLLLLFSFHKTLQFFRSFYFLAMKELGSTSSNWNCTREFHEESHLCILNFVGIFMAYIFLYHHFGVLLTNANDIIFMLFICFTFQITNFEIFLFNFVY